LNPRKAKDLLYNLSKEINLPEELLEDLTEFYWAEVRKVLTSIDHYHVLVSNIGTFHIKKDEVLFKDINKLEATYNKLSLKPRTTIAQCSRYVEVEENLKKLKKLVAFNKEQAIRKQENKIVRENERKIKEDLAAQRANS
jgi:RNA processing factor Prp31